MHPRPGPAGALGRIFTVPGPYAGTVSALAEPEVDSTTVAPPTALRDCIGRQVGYRMVGYEPGEHVGMPSTSLTLILSFDEPLTMSALPDPGQSPTSLWTLISGVHDAPAVIDHDGNQHGVQLDLTPVGVRALFGVPAAALGPSVVSLEELMGPAAQELLERTWGARSWADRFAHVDTALTELRARHEGRPGGTVRPELAWAWGQITRSGGAVQVDTLADELGWSRRHLSGRFRAEFGVTPSTARRLARFEVATGLLRDGRRRSLAEVAAESGYADQSHLSREFRRMAGRSVTRWMADEQFPSVHDGDVLDG